MEGYFGAGLRANLPRDDTCTVLAEFGNEYTDNGFERFLAKEKRRLMREEKEQPVWRGGTAVGRQRFSMSMAAPHRPLPSGRGATAADARPASAHVVHMLLREQKRFLTSEEHSDAEINEIVKERKVKEAAEKYNKAREIRELFARQRDREAHSRDLEYVDKRGVEYLPDGTKVRHEVEQQPSSSSSSPSDRRASRSGSLLRRVGSLRSLNKKIPQQKLSQSDQLLLQDFFAPAVDDGRYRDGGEAGGAGAPGRGSGGLVNSNHAKRSRAEGFVCNTADDLGCPVDASVGTVGVFRQVRRWNRHVPQQANFCSKGLDWQPRLDLPLQEDARSFDTLVATQMQDQHQMNRRWEEERNQRTYGGGGSSTASTPAFFDGDGDGAECCVHPTGMAPPLPMMREDYNGGGVGVGADNELEAQRRAHYRLYDSPPPKPDNVASPMMALQLSAPREKYPPAASAVGGKKKGQQKVVPRPPPGGARPNSARTAAGAASSARLQSNSMRFGLSPQASSAARTHPAAVNAHALRRKEKEPEIIHGEGWSDTDEDEQQQQYGDRDQQQQKFTPRQFKAPPQYRTLAVDPRFTRPNVQSVGQRMMMSDATEMQFVPQKRQPSPATITAFLRGGPPSPRRG